MEATLVINYHLPVRLTGNSSLVNGSTYTMFPKSYNLKGQVLTFECNGFEYVYVSEIDYYESDRKSPYNKIKIGYCKIATLINYRKYANQFGEIIKTENWFDEFEFAKIGDLFKIAKVELNKDLTTNYSKYFKQLICEFKITNTEINFSNTNEYPAINLNQNSPNYCKIEYADHDQLYSYSTKDEGNFFTKNFKNKINTVNISESSKELMYEGIIKICFRIDKIYREVLSKLAIEDLQTIVNFVKNIPSGTDPHVYINNYPNNLFSTAYSTKTDKIIAHLLIDWGYKDLTSTKDLPLEVNEDQFFGGFYKPFNNYYNALVNLYQNLYGKDENSLFDAPSTPPNTWSIAELSEQDNKRFQYLSFDLSSSVMALLSYDERMKFIHAYMDQKYLSQDAEDNVLKILHSFYLFPEEGQKFLDYLLIRKDGITTNFEILFNKIDDDNIRQISPVVGFFAQDKKNRRNFIYGLYQIWKKSKYDFRYLPPNVSPNNDGINPNAFFLTTEGSSYYQSNTDGEYFVTLETAYEVISPMFSTLKETIETKYEVNGNLKSEKVFINRITKHNRYHTDVYLDPGALFITEKKEMVFHLYQPINMVGYKEHENLKEYLPQDPIVPAFVFYYCKKYDELKDINAAWFATIDISLDIILFFSTGGISIIKNFKYLKYITKIGKALRATVATQETVMILRGAEVGFELFTITSAMCFHASNYIATTTDSETAKKLARVFFWLTMTGAGATVYARIKATRAAKEIAANTPYYASLPSEIKPLIDYLAGAEEVAVAAFKTNLQTNYPKLFQKFTELTNTGGVDYQRIFMQEFKNAHPSQYTKIENAMTNNNNVVAHWKSLYDKGITDRKIIEVVTKREKVDAIIKYYTQATNTEMRAALENDWDFTTRWRFLDKVGADDAHFLAYKADVGLIKRWKIFHAEANTTEKFGNLTASKQIEFLTEHGNNFMKFKNNPKLIYYWEKIHDNPLNITVHSTYIKKVEFLEDVEHTYTVKKQYPSVHLHHPGLEETIANHINGSPVYTTHNGNKHIIGYTGFHADYAVTELSPINLIESTLPGGKKYFPGPLPTVNAPIQTAIKAGTEISGLWAKDCQVWMWGFVTKTENGVLSLRLDTNGNPIRSWVKKSNSAQTTIFTGMNADKTLIEVTYARHNLTVDDWIRKSGRVSNEFEGKSSDGGTIIICIGPEVLNKPTLLPSRTLPYGTIYPIK